MTITTSVPKVAFSDTGVSIPDESDILEGVLADMDAAFGGGMNKGLTTPQGQLAQSLAAIVGDKNDRIAELANNVNPDVAAGRWQDAIGRIYFIDRIAASGTVVSATLNGLVGTVIPAGSLAQDSSGYLYSSLAAATIGSTGTVTTDFQCQTTGPIACPVGSLTRIYKAITGWDSITNTTAGTVGVDVESRADFEYRRRKSVAANAINSLQSVYAAVLDVDGVVDAYVMDNPGGSAKVVGASNYSLLAHSLYVAVAGGKAADIAAAIWGKKPAGCDYNGNTSATVEDTNYDRPRPTYTVKWVTPTAVPIYFSIQIAQNANLPATIIALAKAAVVAAFNGADGGSRARIGATLYAGRFYAGVAATNANVQILSVLLGTTAPGTGTSVTMGIDQRPTIDASNISVTLV